MKTFSGFTLEEYLTIFNTFILGNVTSIFFSNWASWIQNRTKMIFNLRHLVFTILVFVLTVDFWWVTYYRVGLVTSHESLFFLSLLDPIILYILTIELFPKVGQDILDMGAYFVRKERLIYALFGLNFLVALIISTITGEVPLIHTENAYRTVAFIICGGAVLVNRGKLYNTLLVVGILLLLMHIVFEGNPPANASASGFSFAEYVTVYVSFFYGFVAYLFLTGWAQIVQHINKIHFGKEYFAWTVLAFALLVDSWWGDWMGEPYIAKHLGYLLVSLITPIVFYMQATVMFPVMRSNVEINLPDFFRRNEKLIYMLFGIIFVSNFATDGILGDQGLADTENYFRAGAILLAVIAYFKNSVKVRRIVLVIGWLVFVIHLLIH